MANFTHPPTAIELPALCVGNWLGVYVEPAELASSRVWGATVNPEPGGRIIRRFFASELDVLSWAAGQADAQGLPLFNLSDPVAAE